MLERFKEMQYPIASVFDKECSERARIGEAEKKVVSLSECERKKRH